MSGTGDVAWTEGTTDTGARLIAASTGAPRVVSMTRIRGLGVFSLLLAAISIPFFGLSQPASARVAFTFGSAQSIALPHLELPVRWFSLSMAAVIVLGGATLLLMKSKRGAYGAFAVAAVAFLWSFLAWAARGNSLNLTSVLASSLVAAIPLIFGSMSGILCERSGVINIAIEGQFLAGAFMGAMIGSWTRDLWLGLLAGAAVGALLGLLLAFLSLRYAVDQIIVGVVLVALATGLTNYLTNQLLNPFQNTLNSPSTFPPIAIPVLDKIPIAGPVLFDQNIFVYLALVLVVTVDVALFRSRWGLRVRSVGEHPEASQSVGISVVRTRYRSVILGGAVAGVGGVAFTLGSVGEFSVGMSAGLGFVALAVMIFGRWRPYNALLAALLFGFSDALQSILAVLNVPIPSPFLIMAPYLVTIGVVAGLVGRAVPPGADGKPFLQSSKG